MKNGWITIAAFYAQRLIPGVLSIAALPLLYETCGAETYKLYSVYLLFSSTLALLLGNWVCQGATRNLTQHGIAPKTWLTTCHLLAASAILSGAVSIAAIPLVLPDLSPSRFGLPLAVAILTIQGALLPILQALGHHLFCLVSEVLRTAGVVAVLIAWHVLEPTAPSTVEWSIALATTLATFVLTIPLGLEFTRSRATRFPPAELVTTGDFFNYGGPLAAYNGMSLWMQFQARASMLAITGPTAGALVMIFDVSQRVVSALSAPLIASQVPPMIVAFNQRNMSEFMKRVRRVQYFLAVCALVLALAAICAYYLGLWILDERILLAALLTSLAGNILLQTTIPTQKFLEFSRRTLALAIAMAISTATAWASRYFLPAGLRNSAPGYELLVGGAILLSLVCILDHKFRGIKYSSNNS